MNGNQNFDLFGGSNSFNLFGGSNSFDRLMGDLYEDIVYEQIQPPIQFEFRAGGGQWHAGFPFRVLRAQLVQQGYILAPSCSSSDDALITLKLSIQQHGSISSVLPFAQLRNQFREQGYSLTHNNVSASHPQITLEFKDRKFKFSAVGVEQLLRAQGYTLIRAIPIAAEVRIDLPLQIEGSQSIARIPLAQLCKQLYR